MDCAGEQAGRGWKVKYVHYRLSNGLDMSTFPEIAEILEKFPKSQDMDFLAIRLIATVGLISAQSMKEGIELERARKEGGAA